MTMAFNQSVVSLYLLYLLGGGGRIVQAPRRLWCSLACGALVLVCDVSCVTHQNGTSTDYTYDGYGRLTKTTRAVTTTQDRDVELTLKDWGAVEKSETKVGATVYARTTYHYDEAIRSYKTVRDDTVGSLTDITTEVVLDKNGDLAAGTSTGGMTNKRFGRVGDVPVIGAGTYANNKTAAISCTVSPRVRSAIRKPPIWLGVASPSNSASKAVSASAGVSARSAATPIRGFRLSLMRAPSCA